jgi:hypothetical protein
MDMVVVIVAVVEAAVVPTEAQTMIGLTLKIQTVMRMKQTKKTKKTSAKKTKMMMIKRRQSSFFYF